MSHAAELLRDAVFKDKDVVELECGIVMPVRVERYDRKPDLFSKNFDGVLFFFGSWRRFGRSLRLGGFLAEASGRADCEERCHHQKPNCASKPGHFYGFGCWMPSGIMRCLI